METDWSNAVNKLAPQIVKIATTSGYGTGFICYGGDIIRTVATAWHVIEGASNKPVTIYHDKGSIVCGPKPHRDLTVAHFNNQDAALLIVPAPELPKPVVPLLEKDKTLSVGTEVGWLGYPHLAAGLCFFSGRISAVYKKQFLVDGTAIHGVSGGPAFCSTPQGLRIVGSISAYLPNVVGQTTLPGLSVINDISAHRDIHVTGG